MKKFISGIISSVFLTIIACGGISYMTPDELNLKIPEGNSVIIDLRDNKKYSDGHINGAINMEYNNLTFLRNITNSNIDKKNMIIIYCGEGIKSDQAAEILAENGFKEIRILKGGYSEWIKQGYPAAK
jgi:rhodanese-related sulfurtransferase